MAETIEIGCDGNLKWHWYNIMNDLEIQGNVKVSIDPMSFQMGTFGGETDRKEKFAVTWWKDLFLLVSFENEIPELIKAFSKVVEYTPFCKYINEYGLITFEWDKVNPRSRFIELLQKGYKPKLITDKESNEINSK